MKNIHTRPRRTVAALGLLLAITAAHAAPPAPADSTQRTFAQSVNIAAPLLAQMSAAQTVSSGVSGTFRALAGREIYVNGAWIRFAASGDSASVGRTAGMQWVADLSPAGAAEVSFCNKAFLLACRKTTVDIVGIRITADGVEANVCSSTSHSATLGTTCATRSTMRLTTEAALYGGSWQTASF